MTLFDLALYDLEANIKAFEAIVADPKDPLPAEDREAWWEKIVQAVGGDR